MVTHNMQTRSSLDRHHQSVRKDYSTVVFKAVDLRRFPGGHKISGTKLHVVLVDHLTKEEEVGPYSKTSLRTFYASFRWGNFSMVRGNSLEEWNCSISPNSNQDKQIEVPSTIGVTLVPVTVLENLITQEDVKRFTEQSGPFLKNFNVQTLIVGTARSQVTSLLTHNRTQNYVHRNDLNHWWNSMNCETLCSILKAYYGVQWKKSDGSIEQALMNLKFSLCYADRSLEKETADAYFNLIEIYERTYGPLSAQLESTIANMIEQRLQPQSQLYKDFKKRKNESIRQGAAETVQLCFDRIKLCMENARTIIRQGQLYGSPDRVICHHHQGGDTSFWSEYPRPDIKLVEPLKPVTPDQADIPTAYVQSRNFLGRITDEHFTRENKEFIKEQETQCMKQFTANVMNETKNKQREASMLAKKARQPEKRRVDRLEEEEKNRSNVPVEYICDTCGNTGHKRRDCSFNDHRDVNASNLRWADSPIGQVWQYYGYNSYCCQSNLPDNDYTGQLRGHQYDADRCRKKRKRGQSPMRDDSNQSSGNRWHGYCNNDCSDNDDRNDNNNDNSKDDCNSNCNSNCDDDSYGSGSDDMCATCGNTHPYHTQCPHSQYDDVNSNPPWQYSPEGLYAYTNGLSLQNHNASVRDDQRQGNDNNPPPMQQHQQQRERGNAQQPRKKASRSRKPKPLKNGYRPQRHHIGRPR